MLGCRSSGSRPSPSTGAGLICEKGLSRKISRPQKKAENLQVVPISVAAVTGQDIADAIRDARSIKIDRRKIHLDEPIKTVGTRMVSVEIGDGVIANVKTMVVEQK